MDLRQNGFTLIELMIVATIVSVIAGIAVPNLLSSRAVANERAVASALRTISTAQTQCQSRAVVDLDKDGQGEALGLSELAGTRTLRGGAPALSPPSLGQSVGTLDPAGHALNHGYRIALHLPNAAGAGLLAIPANDANIDPDQAETTWSCIAWPVDRGRSGTVTFFVNQTGEILVSTTANYSGTTSVPPCGAALIGVPSSMIVGGRIAANTIGADGNMWTLLR